MRCLSTLCTEYDSVSSDLNQTECHSSLQSVSSYYVNGNVSKSVHLKWVHLYSCTLIVISNQSKGSLQSSSLVLRALNPEHFTETPVHSKEVVD